MNLGVRELSDTYIGDLTAEAAAQQAETSTEFIGALCVEVGAQSGGLIGGVT